MKGLQYTVCVSTIWKNEKWNSSIKMSTNKLWLHSSTPLLQYYSHSEKNNCQKQLNNHGGARGSHSTAAISFNVTYAVKPDMNMMGFYLNISKCPFLLKLFLNLFNKYQKEENGMEERVSLYFCGRIFFPFFCRFCLQHIRFWVAPTWFLIFVNTLL